MAPDSNIGKNRQPQGRALRRACALALVLMGGAGSAGAINLQQAYEAALNNDPAYRMNYYENESAKENKIMGRAGLLPAISGYYGGTRNRAELTTLIGTRENVTDPQYISRNATVQLRQPLFNMDAYARYRQAVSSTNEAASRFQFNRSEVIVRVVGAYIDALYATDQLNLTRAQRATLTEQMKINNRMFEKGEGTKTDMLEVQARLDVSEAQLLEAEDNVRNARATLENLTGADVGELAPLDPKFVIQTKQAPFEEWRAIALENNADLKAARFAIESAQQEINKSRAGHAPRLDLVANYGRVNAETITTVDQKILNRSIGFQLNVPLYQGGYVNAASRQSVAGLERAKANLDGRTNAVLLELRKSHSLVQSSVAKLAALAKAAESGKLLVKATEQSIKGGVRINLDLLNAEQQLVSTQRDLAQARYAYLLGLMRMRSAAGTLTADDVRELAANFHR